MNHIETLAHILDQCRIKDAEISDLKSEVGRLKRYELEYKKREWDEAILYNNIFKASMLVSELANVLDGRATENETEEYTKAVESLLKKAKEISYQQKDPNH